MVPLSGGPISRLKTLARAPKAAVYKRLTGSCGWSPPASCFDVTTSKASTFVRTPQRSSQRLADLTSARSRLHPQELRLRLRRDARVGGRADHDNRAEDDLSRRL